MIMAHWHKEAWITSWTNVHSVQTYMRNQLYEWIVDNFKQSFIVATILLWLSEPLFELLVWKYILRCKKIPT